MGDTPDIAPSASVGARSGSSVALRLAGDWTLAAPLPDAGNLFAEAARAGPLDKVTLDLSGLGRWDSVLPAFLYAIAGAARAKGAVLVADTAPEGLQRLLSIALAVPPRTEAASGVRPNPLARLGLAVMGAWGRMVDAVNFLGEVVLALVDVLRGRAQYRVEDVARVFYQRRPGGPAHRHPDRPAWPASSWAFSGGSQLAMFGAQLYVANLVTTGMAQEMGPLMAAVIMAGRTGAAFAAELGTMQVNQEIDAQRTLAINPMQFLVVPRMLALMLMLPLLALYAVLMGILGGGLIGVAMFDIDPILYAQQMRQMIGIEDFAGGIFKAAVFGAIVAMAGCLRGMRCGQDAAAVGNAATSAVVTSIVGIVVADAVINVLFNVLGIA